MFKKITESQISRAIVSEFSKWFEDYIVSDVIVVGLLIEDACDDVKFGSGVSVSIAWLSSLLANNKAVLSAAFASLVTAAVLVASIMS